MKVDHVFVEPKLVVGNLAVGNLAVGSYEILLKYRIREMFRGTAGVEQFLGENLFKGVPCFEI